VVLELRDHAGALIGTTTTDANGHYRFEVETGIYTVDVAAANFSPGGALAGYASTTGDSRTNTVNFDNVLTYDFGYKSTSPGNGTLGYWKNHPSAWPVSQITIGGVTYSETQAINWMSTPSSGDKTIDLFKQLVAAKLNVLAGNASSCISDTITAADNWLSTYPLGSKVSGGSAAWATGGPLQTKLDNYNNGLLCAPHRG